MSKFLTENFDFGGHLSTFRAENTPKSKPAQKKMPKHFLINSKTNLKSPENEFFNQKIGQNDPNFDFGGQLSTFRAENTPKSWPFKFKNNA